ncbi:unnamed protein product [Chrysodeixis includens]|uniref:Uncharacterized protein n=1 Tax=Chrysodeixis includens TaxID=689277 RepID=A0A9N8PZQ2_CHRIL|nr:unnamed protein product [Chrysodeixis includens]
MSGFLNGGKAHIITPSCSIASELNILWLLHRTSWKSARNCSTVDKPVACVILMMIRVACLLVLTARALAAPAPPAPRPAPPGPSILHYEWRPENLRMRTLFKVKRSAPQPPQHDNRKLFLVKSPCRTDKCAHTQLYEFDLFRVEPSVNGKGVYY